MIEPADQTTAARPGITNGEGGVPSGFQEAVVVDAAGRLDVDETEVEIVDARSVDWPDGSLGCPQPGVLYTQVITPGYQVVVAAGGTTLDYRLDRRGAFRVCDTAALPDVRDPDVTIPAPSPPDT